MCDKPGIVATSIHSYKSFMVGSAIVIGPCHDFGNKMFAPKNRTCGNSVNIYCSIILALFPNFGIGKGNGPDTGNFPIDFNLPNAVLQDFGFNHRSFESRPLVGGKNYFLIGSGQSIEPKYFIEVANITVMDFQRITLISGYSIAWSGKSIGAISPCSNSIGINPKEKQGVLCPFVFKKSNAKAIKNMDIELQSFKNRCYRNVLQANTTLLQRFSPGNYIIKNNNNGYHNEDVKQVTGSDTRNNI
jgi:hypothetical protein